MVYLVLMVGSSARSAYTLAEMKPVLQSKEMASCDANYEIVIWFYALATLTPEGTLRL